MDSLLPASSAAPAGTMDAIRMLESMGLELPSPSYLAGALLFGTIGVVAWRHGKKNALPTPKWIGLALMLYPYAVAQTWLMLLVGAALCVWLALAWN